MTLPTAASRPLSAAVTADRQPEPAAPPPRHGGQALANLDKVRHIVVLMLESRSFDHMLGYLSLEGGRADIDGLRPEFCNRHAGLAYPVHPLGPGWSGAPHAAVQDGASVARQIACENGGFIEDHLLNHPGEPHLAAVMGYYNAEQVPVYDFLARQFCVCDRWFSSVPGGAWPNRLYAVSGRAAGSRDSKRVPLYSNKSFLRHLDRARVSWKFYAPWKPWTLALTDDHYRTSEHYEPFGGTHRRYGFIGDALAGGLPSVSWIDPHFYENGGHAPSDVLAGQAQVAQVYQALAASPQWPQTMFIVTYDQHGGFYDHVAPGAASDNDPGFQRYGVRVPALVISPWTAPAAASHVVYDHTSIIKTILLRFCRGADGDIPDMGKRVAAAAHLGGLLSEAAPRAAPPPPPCALATLAAWRAELAAQEWAVPTAGAANAFAGARCMSAAEAGAVAAEKQIAKTAKQVAQGYAGGLLASNVKRVKKRRQPGLDRAPPMLNGM
ncbi:MAG: alkaline phosphatase family protein [Pseudomonadota bacterium]